MSVGVQQGTLSIGMQAAKVGSAAFVMGDYDWQRTRAVLFEGGAMQDVRPFMQEIDDAPTIAGAYKVGRFSAGRVSLVPRLEGTLGWYLYSMLGAVTTTTGEDVLENAVVGVNTHRFSFAANAYSLPWFSLRKYVPGDTDVASSASGEVAYDCKMDSMRLVVPNAGKLAMEFNYRGRSWALYDNPSWTYANTLEDSGSSPDAGNGHIKINGVEYPFVAMELLGANGLSSIQEEYVIGSGSPDDFAVLGPRVFQIRLTYKYSVKDLYRLALTGSSTGTTWSPTPWETNFAAGSPDTWAFEAYFEAPDVIGATSTKHQLLLRAGRVIWDVESIRLAPNQLGFQQVTGTVVTPASGVSFFDALIGNGQANYTI